MAKSCKSWYNGPVQTIGREKDGMVTRHQRRLALLALIVLELLGAVIVLRLVLRLYGNVPEVQPARVGVPTKGREAQPVGIWLAAEVPAALAGAVRDWVARQPGEFAWTEPSTADLTVDWQKRSGARSLAKMILVPVAPFSSLRGDVAADELRRAWLGHPRPQDTVSRLLVSPETAAALDALFGPRRGEAAVMVTPAAELPDRLWTEPNALAIVPFDQLQSRLKALSVDGMSVLDRDLNMDRYPLLATVWISGSRELERSLAVEIEERGLVTNRHLDHLTILVMTGVTALTRHVALEMEAQNDYGWPARQVADLLSAADLTHVSNEVSFMPGCEPEPRPLGFCAKPGYLQTLRLVGTDLVELTGNHNLDFGPGPALHSLDLYAQAGMHTYGGGRNAAEARRPVFLSHNGNRLAFLGYNQFGPEYAWATADGPGAARFSLEAVQSDLAQIRSQADVILVNIQHTETYSATPLPAQVADFRATIQAGADVVSGSQAHQPQAIEFYEGGLILYGLGNLFFDQTWSEPTRQSLVVRHLIYEGRLIATELIPTVMNDDYQPRPASDNERRVILRAVFSASGW
jgi:hypothetical protein